MEQNEFPLVSIVTPSFNSAKYLEANIHSVINQHYPKLEHIVVDGGSSDNTVEILKKYSHLKWISEKDRGQSDALNKGFKLAKGEIIGWLNSDDTYNEGAVNFAVMFLKENKDVDIIFSDENIIDENGNITKLLKGGDVTFNSLLLKNIIRQPTVFMRKKVIDNLGGVREDLHFVMDRELWLRGLISGFKFKYIKGKILANFRFCKGTKSKENPLSFQEEWLKVLNELLCDPKIDREKIHFIKEAIKEVECQILFLEFVKNFKEGRYFYALSLFGKVLMKNKRNIVRIGVWKLLIREIFAKMHLWR